MKWEVVTGDDPRGQPSPMYRGLVALVSCSPSIAVVTADGSTVESDQWENVARLIAAAPEMRDRIAELEAARDDALEQASDFSMQCEKFRYASDKQAVAWKARAESAEADRDAAESRKSQAFQDLRTRAETAEHDLRLANAYISDLTSQAIDAEQALAAARGTIDDMTEHQVVLGYEIERLRSGPAGPFETCSDCGREMVWSYAETVSPTWMCPRCTLLRAQIAEVALTERDALRDQLAAARNDNDIQRQFIADLRRDRQDALDALAAARAENERLREEIGKWKDEWAAMRADRGAVAALLAALKSRSEGSVEEVREPVRWFAEQMERKLKANDHKIHWTGIRTMPLFDMLMAETKELHSAFGIGGELTDPSRDMERIIDEAADVANYAMMIADKARAVLAADDREGE